jgi:hypothetical protein
MSIYNSQSPFNQGAKRSEITAANKKRRQSRRQRVKDIKEAGGPEFYSADGYHVGEFDKKGRNIQYPEKRYSKKNPPNERKSPINQAVKNIEPTIRREKQKTQLMVPMPKPKVKVYKSVGSRLVKEKPLPMERLPLQPRPIIVQPELKIHKSVGKRYKSVSERLVKQKPLPMEPMKVSPMNQGDIKQAPSRLTQAYRRFKNDESGPYNMAKNIVTAAATLAPIPSLGKINAVKKVGKAFSNAAKGKKRVGSIGGFKEFANPKLRNHFNPVKKSKPVDYMGPNPAHKTGAGGNSYPK